MHPMPRLAELLPARFAQDCAVDGFVEACKAGLEKITSQDTAVGAASVLGGALGGPLVFLGIYAGGAILEWKRDKRRKGEAKARFGEIKQALDRIDAGVRDQKELAGLLDELLRRDREMGDRLERAEQSTTTPDAAVESAIRALLDDLDLEIRDGFDGIRIYLSNMSAWMADQGAEITRTREGVGRIESAQQAQGVALIEIQRQLQELDQRQKTPGEHRPELTAADRALLEGAKAHGDAKARAQAAIIAGDFAAADPLIEEVTKRAASELFDALTLKGDRHYYAGESDAAIAPYEKALELRPDDFTARNNAAIAHNQARLGDIAAHQRRAIEIHKHTLTLAPDHSLSWATTQHNLGTAWGVLPTGDRGENLRRAIACCEAALEVYTRAAHPVDWATTQNNLGTAWGQLPTGDRGENLRRAIACFEAALEVYTRAAHPVAWAATQHNLAIASAELADYPGEDRCARLTLAIGAGEGALARIIHI